MKMKKPKTMKRNLKSNEFSCHNELQQLLLPFSDRYAEIFFESFSFELTAHFVSTMRTSNANANATTEIYLIKILQKTKMKYSK